MKPYLLAAVVLATAVTTGTASAVPRSEAMLANTCAGCHGTDGHSAGGNMPSLGGLSKRYLYKTMRDYRDDLRPSTIMGRIARGYSDLELRAIASHFAAQSWQSRHDGTQPKLIKRGAELHQQLCASCHTDNGRTQSGETPRLAGQWFDYLQDQIGAMSAVHYRGSQPNRMLQRMSELSAADGEALSHFYASQR